MSVSVLTRSLAVKVWSHSLRCACTSVCDSWLAWRSSSSVRHGIRTVCDAAPVGEKASRRKDGEPGMQESTSALTCNGDSRWNHEGGAKSNPETAFRCRNKGG